MDQETKAFLQLILHRLDSMDGRLGGLEKGQIELKEDVTTLKADVGTLKQDVTTLKADVGTLKQDVTTLKADVGTLKENVATLEGTVHTINLKLENVIEPKIQLLYENQVEIIGYQREKEHQERRISALETDVFALKCAFKSLKQG